MSMSTQGVKERVISTIQRDHLADFLKESVEQSAGCFYYSLIGVFNALYPDEVISREAKNRIFLIDSSLDRSPSELIDTLQHLEDVFKLQVSQIEITRFAIEESRDLRDKVPMHIPIVKDKAWLPQRLDDQSSAVIVWRYRFNPNKIGHMTCLDRTDMLLGEDGDPWNIGGEKGMAYLMDRDYFPTFIFHLSKLEKS